LPDDPDVLYDLAEAEFSVGRLPEAEAAMRRVVSQDARFSRLDEARQFLAMLDLAANPAPPATAGARVDQILKAKPNYVPALFARAAMLERQAETGPAQETYGKVLDLHPDFAPAKRRLVVLFAENPTGNNQKIFEMALQARQVFPDDLALAKALGILLYTRSDYTRAASLLNECARKTESDASLMFYLGMTQFRLKQMAESKRSLQQALDLKLKPDLAAVAQRTLAEIK
jgi:tetratricopeptide (TPR) repeat protein